MQFIQNPDAANPQSSEAPARLPARAREGGAVVISEGTVIKGEIRDCGRMEISGYFEGAVSAKALIVHPGGRFFGILKSDEADIRGTLQGEVFVRNLMHVGATGSVTGNIQYGRISIEPGGDLSADLRNIPPEIAGDMSVTVSRGKSVVISTLDLTAVDPDDDASALIYSVSGESNGHVAFAAAPQTRVARFKQTDLEASKVIFVHNGQNGPAASFAVVVADAAGATSGKPQTVNVAVRA